MIVDKNSAMKESSPSSEDFRIQVTNPLLHDRLRTLSAEYDLSVEALVNAAVKRLLDDVDFVRSLRMGKTGGA